MSKSRVLEAASRLIAGIRRVFFGNDWAVLVVVATLIAEGHALLLGPVGSGKTVLSKALAAAIGGSFKRVQITNETLPSDIVGFMVYTPGGEGKLVKGPIFANIVLLDEINRAPPRTLSALLEAMQERQVTIDGAPLALPRPHVVIATMNITEVELGYTQQLPYAVQDRFMSSVYIGYADAKYERLVVSAVDRIEEELSTPSPSVTLDDVINLINAAKGVYVDGVVLDYMMEIVGALRKNPRLAVTISTRAPIALFKLSRAFALLAGRNYVIPDDVKAAAQPALVHRILIKPEYRGSVTASDLVSEVLSKIPVPRGVS